jgi:hypothetical protein
MTGNVAGKRGRSNMGWHKKNYVLTGQATKFKAGLITVFSFLSSYQKPNVPGSSFFPLQPKYGKR